MAVKIYIIHGFLSQDCTFCRIFRNKKQKQKTAKKVKKFRTVALASTAREQGLTYLKGKKRAIFEICSKKRFCALKYWIYILWFLANRIGTGSASKLVVLDLSKALQGVPYKATGRNVQWGTK
jgi:hypothetical protein